MRIMDLLQKIISEKEINIKLKGFSTFSKKFSKKFKSILNRVLIQSIDEINSFILFNKSFTITVELLSSKEFNSKIIDNLNSSAFMFFQNNYIYIQNKEQLVLNEEFYSTLHHEIIHSLLFQINAGIELWLSEGIATFFANKLSLKSMNDFKIVSLKKLKKCFHYTYDEYYSSSFYFEYIYKFKKSIINDLITNKIDVHIPVKHLKNLLTKIK